MPFLAVAFLLLAEMGLFRVTVIFFFLADVLAPLLKIPAYSSGDESSSLSESGEVEVAARLIVVLPPRRLNTELPWRKNLKTYAAGS